MISKVVLKSMQQDIQIHNWSLRIDIVNFNIRQEKMMHWGWKFFDQDLCNSYTYMKQALPFLSEAKLVTFLQLG